VTASLVWIYCEAIISVD